MCQSLEDLAKETIFKIVLCTDSSEFPFVNIHGDPLENVYAITCVPGMPRTKVLEHIRALLEQAQNILIFDKFMGQNWDTTKVFFEKLVPRRNLSIFLSEEQSLSIAGKVKGIFSGWKVKKDNSSVYRSRHDRYILIDRQVEVVLTSGVDYLFDENKECTVLIRSKSA